MIRILCLSVLVAAWARSVAALEIYASEHQLIANQPGQRVAVFVHGGEEVAGVNLYVQIGDGGPELADYGLPPGVDGPAITAVDLKTDTIFAGVPDPQVDQGGLPQVAVWSLGIAAQGGHVTADGRLATLTVDTTGFGFGEWELRLSEVLEDLAGGPYATDFAGLPAVVHNGTIEVGLPGDTHPLDGRIDLNDLNRVRNSFGSHAEGDTYPFDGDVDLDDLNAVRNHFGTTAGANPVPEPATAVLAIAISALATVLRHGASRRPGAGGVLSVPLRAMVSLLTG